MEATVAGEDLRYPIGRWDVRTWLSAEEAQRAIATLEAAPARIRAAVAGLDDGQLDTPYRPGGWTMRQLVHHLPDSHLNAYVRMRLALTEKAPAIKTYEEARWAELPDARSAPVELSLQLLAALHARWVLLLRALDAAAWQRTFRHPELGEMSVDQSLGFYAWHCRHHEAHLTALRARQGW
jgi:hypothetical protein